MGEEMQHTMRSCLLGNDADAREGKVLQVYVCMYVCTHARMLDSSTAKDWLH